MLTHCFSELRESKRLANRFREHCNEPNTTIATKTKTSLNLFSKNLMWRPIFRYSR